MTEPPLFFARVGIVPEKYCGGFSENPSSVRFLNPLAGEIATEASRLMRSLKALEKAERKKRDRDAVESTGIRQTPRPTPDT